METEGREVKLQSQPSPSELAQKPSPLRRAGQVGLSIINPFSDLMVIYRTGVKPVVVKLGILRDQLKRNSAPKELLTWEQAVQRSERSVEQLRKAFRRKRFAWWSLMTVTIPLALILLLMILGTYDRLSMLTVLRALITDVVLASCGCFALVKVLDANYRLWQLAARRVSVDERGTFQDYKNENSLWLQVVTVRAHN
jgi:hypothetical protein